MTKSKFATVLELEGDGMPKDTSRKDFVRMQICSYLAPPAMDFVREGFESLTSPEWFSATSATDLRAILCNTHDSRKDFDIREIFDVVMDDEMASCPPLVGAFWEVVSIHFDPELKRQFLFFVTGVRTLPEKGTEQLRIELPFLALGTNEHKAVIEMLPQAHTCTNTLEIPNYYESKSHVDGCKCSHEELCALIAYKLRMAISETDGYELDAIDGAVDHQDEHACEQGGNNLTADELIRQDAEDKDAAEKFAAQTMTVGSTFASDMGGESNVELPNIDWSFKQVRRSCWHKVMYGWVVARRIFYDPLRVYELSVFVVLIQRTLCGFSTRFPHSDERR